MTVWMPTKVLITVRTYPTPAYKGVEVSCTAGVTDAGAWIRLFPVPFRYLARDRRFRKYQWIELRTRKASDPRPESYHPDIDSIEVLTEPLPTAASWQARKNAVFPLKAESLCWLQAERDAHKAPTLGLVKPREIQRLIIEPDRPDWTTEELARLRRKTMFDAAPLKELERIPHKFKYQFLCDDPACRGHEMMCSDWEMAQSYRAWSQQYPREWEAKFRQRYEHEMIHKYDTHFYVGTIHGHPASWIIVGLFYPPSEPPQRPQQLALL